MSVFIFVFRKITAAALAAALFVGTVTTALAQDRAVENAISGRQAIMDLYAYNLGVLGAMVRGTIDYNADAAQAAADNLVAVNGLRMGAVWMPGTGTDVSGDTRALPAIWAQGSDIGAKGAALREAIMGMQDAADDGLDAVKAAMGPLGESCNACHKAFRQPE